MGLLGYNSILIWKSVHWRYIWELDQEDFTVVWIFMSPKIHVLDSSDPL